MSIFNEAYLTKAEKVFLNPLETYPWEDIINGTLVSDKYGDQRKMYAVAQNTFRGFHRIDKSCAGAKEEFLAYFTTQKNRLVDSLSKIENRDDLNELEDSICEEVCRMLSNCKPNQLDSYNKIRKPVDLYIEHLVSMSNELDHVRKKLVPLLFLPLDSQVFMHPDLFDINDLKNFSLKRKSTYQGVQTKETYIALQQLLLTKVVKISNQIKKPFYVIYFDLIWNDRYKKWGNNLFQTNI
jgi:hypothetical protein